MLHNNKVNEDFRKILLLTIKSFIMLPKTEFNPQNLFVKVTAFKIGETLNLSNLNISLITMITKEMKKHTKIL